MADLSEQLRTCFRGRVCLMGLGNVDYGDDGFGAILSEVIAERLRSYSDVTRRHEVINGGTTPERFINSISEKDFNHLIFIDAVEFGGAPGSVIFLGSEEMAGRFPQISTHKISPGLMAGWVEDGGATKAWLLGVQPGSLQPAMGLTKDVQRTLEILEELICDLWVSGN
jgi:hydrogenase maturation protease